MNKSKKYRDRIYIIKDIILTLSEYGELNQTALFSFCGLNISKHKSILNNLEKNELIQRTEKNEGKRTINVFKVTEKGRIFCQEIIDPYEKLFPRKNESSK
ncbi:MarR family transcriptional regulator [Candidatus Nitrosopumilus sp. SW]|uniref:winged helix-turn-helix domain-containing protein n=1 Tax=Candidatus Nitrosopumilus sp. SW TaxID=2508726 RepID=UPI00114F9ACA|nr:winged helix-turn-helix domain-containing protein [Candidatus Nitrosopumilus sp. SW]QDI89516.1 MarR family transcriptional regulator [Candidatus Nitrosopumilus sp. SW]